MSARSGLAETIADYALSVAKRHDNSSAAELHLLAAVRRWRPDAFDQRYPGLTESLAQALSAQRGDATTVPQLTPTAASYLDAVQNPDDAWHLADRLLEALGSALNVARASNAATPASDAANDQLATCAISRPLIERVAGFVSLPFPEVAAVVLSDAYVVAARVLGSAGPDLANRITELAAIEGIVCREASTLSQTVHATSLTAAPEGPQTATQLASALIDVAEWAAAMDDNVTEAETDRIDDVRLELRAQLADRIDARSTEMAEFEEQFDQLVGMQAVKAELRRRVDFLTVSKRRERRGGDAAKHRMHVAFVGNPGTGKTTVARLYGELLNKLGLLPTNKFIEVDRSALVAGYVGQTESKTMEAINRADGGVLFIDEAYALNDNYGSQKGFGEEATDVLVKQMEDRRDRLVVVLAGYKGPTLDFIALNPGLKSRLPLVIDFPDYDEQELIEICRRLADRRELVLTPEALSKMGAVLVAERGQEGFGNARSAENLLEAAHRNVISRTAALGNLATDDELTTVLAEDVPAAAPPRQQQRIGFLREG